MNIRVADAAAEGWVTLKWDSPKRVFWCTVTQYKVRVKKESDPGALAPLPTSGYPFLNPDTFLRGVVEISHTPLYSKWQ